MAIDQTTIRDVTVTSGGVPHPAVDAATVAPGLAIGRYLVLATLGQGGMGVVYLAEQLEPVRRRVALKLIRGRAISADAIAWFEFERQALAQMLHPAIAQVYDAGTTTDGHPWLAMEYVEGEPLTEFAQAHKLDPASRLRLFARVCHGVQHAHQKGLIHRDLKPSNVLVQAVDGVPLPKIIDFGIAVGTETDAQGRTRAFIGDRAGTPNYMSPEQGIDAIRDIDTRSDVYSLGVMLFELVSDIGPETLTAAARGTAGSLYDALARTRDAPRRSLPAVGAAQQQALLAAAQRVPPELRCVLARALAPEREQRYGSAAALAEDLERYLAHRPVHAVPATRLYLARKFARRHRLGLAAAMVAALALVIGTVLALRGLFEARAGRALAEQAATVARIEADKARQIADFVRSMLSAVDPDRARAADTTLLREIIDDAARRASHDLAAQPAVLAAIESTVADAYGSLGESDQSLAHQRAALQASTRAGDDALTRAQYQVHLAALEAGQGDMAASIAQAREVLAALPASVGADDRVRLRLEAEIAGLECDAGEYQACYDRYARIVSLQQHGAGGDLDALSSLNGFARAAGDLERWEESEQRYRELIARVTQSHGPEHSYTLDARNGLAVTFLKQRKFAEAERELNELVPLFERVFGAEHPETVVVASNLGGALRQQQRNAEARPYYERTVAASDHSFGPTSYRSVIARHNLGNLLRDIGELEAAERVQREAVANAPAAFGEGSANRVQMHTGLAAVLTLRGRYAESERELAAAWELAQRTLPPQHRRVQALVEEYVALYRAWNKPRQQQEWEARRAPPP